MADRAQLVRAGAVPVLVQRREDRRVARVAEALELASQQAGPARVDALLGLERAQRLEVEVEPPGVAVEDAELAADELRRRLLLAEEAVAGELDLARAARERRGAMERVQPVQRAALLPQRRLAARVPQQVDLALRRRRADAEPVGRPQRAEPLAECDRPVVERLRLLPGDPVDGAGDEQLVGRDGAWVDRSLEPPRELRKAGARVFELPDQGYAAATASRATRLSPVAAEKK
jgi:hypothetical protein